MEPKFSIGEAVAVLTKDLKIIIPATVVTDIAWLEEGYYFNRDRTEKKYHPAEFCYQVAGYNDPGHWFSGSALRPLRPDDYREEEIETTKEQENV